MATGEGRRGCRVGELKVELVLVVPLRGKNGARHQGRAGVKGSVKTTNWWRRLTGVAGFEENTAAAV